MLIWVSYLRKNLEKSYEEEESDAKIVTAANSPHGKIRFHTICLLVKGKDISGYIQSYPSGNIFFEGLFNISD